MNLSVIALVTSALVSCSPLELDTASLPLDLASFKVGTSKSRVAVLTGTVVDTLDRPVANADVRIAALSLVTRTDNSGRYRFKAVADGTHLVTVRAIGFEPTSAVIAVSGDGEFTQSFLLRPSVNVLDSVNVSATLSDRRMNEFEENRRVGLGKFLTRAELESKRTWGMANIMASQQGAGILRGLGNRGWIFGRRGGASSCPPRGRSTEIQSNTAVYVPDAGEARFGLRCGCYARVWLDDLLMNPGHPADPFDVNQFSPDQIEAVEWYASPASTPAKYQMLNASCGIMVIHTRRP